MTVTVPDYSPTPAEGGPARGSFRDPVLEVRGLCVDYGVGPDSVRAVNDASFTLGRGEVLGVAGESGSGKSTLAYALVRLLRAPGVITGGEVLFHSRPNNPAPGAANASIYSTSVDLLDADAAELRSYRWSEISVVFQSAMHALNPVARIESQLTDALKQHRRAMSSSERRERAIELLRMVGINGDRLRSYPHELSGGMRQRVMIAMALALEPQIVIMDEPTTALDVVTQREILEELMLLRERLGFALIFITHDLSLLLEFADSIAIMYAGRIVERARGAELHRAPRHPYSLGLLSSFPALHGERVHMTGIHGSPPSLKDLPTGCPFHPRCPYAMDRCAEEEPKLTSPVGEHGARTVACLLHDGLQPPPRELSGVLDASGTLISAAPAATAAPTIAATPSADRPAALDSESTGSA